MIVIRCTTKLLNRLKVSPTASSRSSTTTLGDWYATLLHTRRGQFVLAMARKTLLPIVVTGRDLRSFPSRLRAELANVLSTYGVPAATIEAECEAMQDFEYARTDDRSNVGALTELHRLLHYDLDDMPAASMVELSLRLAGTPIVARDIVPDGATCRMFGVPTPWERVRAAPTDD